MIESIHIINLQSHKNSLVKFHPGVNYIIGRSRSGKTVILRGLIKVIQNRPIVGMERWVHKHNPKNIIMVEVVASEGHSVTWQGGSPQKYMVDGEVLSGFGQGVPQAVTDTLHLGELNISGQHDRPFLLFDTPGEVARTLNRVVHLDVIDRALSNWAGEKRRNDQEKKAQESRLAELQLQEAGFPDLKTAGEFIAQLEAWGSERLDKAGRITRLSALQEQLSGLRAGLDAARAPDGVGEAVTWLLDRQAELNTKADKLHRLSDTQQALGEVRGVILSLAPGIRQEALTTILLEKQTEIEDKSARQGRLMGIQHELGALRVQMACLAPGLAQDGWVSEMLTRNARLQAKRRHLARLQALNRQVKKARDGVEAQQTIIIARKAEFHQEFGDHCPLCGQEIR